MNKRQTRRELKKVVGRMREVDTERRKEIEATWRKVVNLLSPESRHKPRPDRHCPKCGRRMYPGNFFLDEDVYDVELAKQHGLTDEQIQEGIYDPDSEYSRYLFAMDDHFCQPCQYWEKHPEDGRAYWNPDSNHYDADAPMTELEKVMVENKRQEEAGQLPLFGDDQS